MKKSLEYSTEQLNVIDHSDSHLQIIPSAGSGKTETIARRCAILIKKGVKPEEIIAFTFTDKAAGELRSRIERHVADVMGYNFLGKINRMYVGTIHAFCFRFYALFTYASYFVPKFNLLLDSDNILLTKQS